MHAHVSVHIKREPQAVFARLIDFASHVDWRYEVTATWAYGEVQEGTRIVQSVQVQGHSAVLELVVTEFVPPERIAFRTRTGTPARGGFRLEPEDGGTRVHVSATVRLNDAASLAEERIRAAAEASARESLGRLKAQLEESP